MKIISFLLVFFAIALAAFSQQINLSPTLTKQDYLQKNKEQKTIAWILFGSGLAMVGGGLAINLSGGILNGKGSKGLWLAYAGGATTLTSIPLFIAASKNKKKGMSLSFKNETAPQFRNSHFIYKPVPSLTFRVTF